MFAKTQLLCPKSVAVWEHCCCDFVGLFSRHFASCVFGSPQVKALKVLDNPRNSLPFIEKILSTLRSEINGDATLIGFIGTPWTLSAYSVEGKSDKECRQTKVWCLPGSCPKC